MWSEVSHDRLRSFLGNPFPGPYVLLRIVLFASSMAQLLRVHQSAIRFAPDETVPLRWW